MGKKRKASQGTEDMTEDDAGIFVMNNEYYVNDRLGRNVLNYVKVIFPSDFLSYSCTHIYSWRFTHRRIQSLGLVFLN